MSHNPQPTHDQKKAEESAKPNTPAQEWGERIETGRDIARGGHDSGPVRGATGDDPKHPQSGQK